VNLQPFKRAFPLLAAGLLLAVMTPGCVTQNMAARMITTAPNRQYTPSPPPELAKFWDHLNKGGGPGRFQYLKLKIGPPPAQLAVAELPPGDYHIRFISGIRTNWEDKKFLTMKFATVTNFTFKPLKEPATIVILHGYMLYKETMAPWASALAQAGYRVVLVDLRGHGKSTGDTVTYGKYETHDLIQMLDQLQARGLCDEKVGVLGLSYGATLALHWAAADPRIQTVVAIAPYDDPEQAAKRLAKELKIPVSPKTLNSAMDIAARRLDLKWSDWSGDRAAKNLKTPALYIGGGHDRISLPSEIQKMTKDSPPGSQEIMVPDVNHFVLGYLLHELAVPVENWFAGHLETATEKPAGMVMEKNAAKAQGN